MSHEIRKKRKRKCGRTSPIYPILLPHTSTLLTACRVLFLPVDAHRDVTEEVLCYATSLKQNVTYKYERRKRFSIEPPLYSLLLSIIQTPSAMSEDELCQLWCLLDSNDPKEKPFLLMRSSVGTYTN